MRIARYGLKMEWPQAAITAYPVWWLGQIFIARFLSLFHGLNQINLIAVTVMATALLLLTGSKIKKNRGGDFQTTSQTSPPSSQREWQGPLLISLLVLSFLSILFIPCRYYDTNSYHLPTLAHWLQQGSLEPWHTVCLRQITRTQAGTFQQLFVVGMAHADPLSELPSLLATIIIACFAWTMAMRWGFTRGQAWIAVLAIWATPQMVFSSLSALDDSPFNAIILCSLFFVIQSIKEPQRALYVALATISICLILATKVPGLLIAPTLLFFLVGNMILQRNRKMLALFAILFIAVGLPLFIASYWNNLVHYGFLFAEQNREVERSSTSLLLRLVRYGIIFVIKPFYGVGTYDLTMSSHFGIALAIFIIPVLLLSAWKRGVSLFFTRKNFTAIQIEKKISAVFLVWTFFLILYREPDLWDQRFMAWMCPLLWLLGIPFLSGLIKTPYLSVCIALFAVHTVFGVFSATGGYVYAVRKWASTGEFCTSDEFQGDLLAPTSYAMLKQGKGGDVIIYIGGEDTLEYPCFGWKLDRLVYCPTSPKEIEELVARQSPQWVVIESEAPPLLQAKTRDVMEHGPYSIAVYSQAKLHSIGYPPVSRTIYRKNNTLSQQ